MGCWDEFCLVCGGPPSSANAEDLIEICEEISEEDKESLRAGLTGLDWLDRYAGVLGTEECIPLGEYNSYGGFQDGTAERPPSITAANFEYTLDHSENLALTCHEKCYTLLQRELGYTLRFQDVWPMLMEQIEITEASSPNPWTSWASNSFRWTSYGGIGKYQEQDFQFYGAVTDGNAWMLQDPTIDERNASRIVEVWRPLVENGFNIPQSSNANLESEFVNLGLSG